MEKIRKWGTFPCFLNGLKLLSSYKQDSYFAWWLSLNPEIDFHRVSHFCFVPKLSCKQKALTKCYPIYNKSQKQRVAQGSREKQTLPLMLQGQIQWFVKLAWSLATITIYKGFCCVNYFYGASWHFGTKWDYLLASHVCILDKSKCCLQSFELGYGIWIGYKFLDKSKVFAPFWVLFVFYLLEELQCFLVSI